VPAIVVSLMLLVVLATPAFADFTADAASTIEAMMTTLQREQALELEGEQVFVRELVLQFYATNGNVPAWTEPRTVGRMLLALEDIRDDGLDPDDYHGPALIALGADTPADPQVLASRDILLTDALHLMLYHLVFGKADPNRLDEDWNLNELYDELDPGSTEVQKELSTFILAAIADEDPGRLLTEVRPELNAYLDLRAGHAFYRKLAAKGGWPEVPTGQTLRQGDSDPRIVPLRKRLALTRDFMGNDPVSSLFDADLAAAVIRFQTRHGLTADGIVGKGTLAAMNVSADERVDQIRINLDRARWVMHHNAGGNLVLVNICSYQVWLIRDRETAWKARVQVGKLFTRTPIFADSMTYLELNPTWTVPRSIANRSILPKVKADPGYLAGQDMVLLDNQGNEISVDSIDWSSVTSMPYIVRQQPGPKNALGRVKFMFPNKHAVYLHDTPSRQNFGRSARAFSSGCIRVENPLELAALLLDDQPGWDRQRIDEMIASGKRTTVRLSGSIPVFLLYWTAFAVDDGLIQFREDLYERDPAVLKALEGPVQPHRRHER